MNGWAEMAKELEDIKRRIADISTAYLVMFGENEQLKAENGELRADRDYYRQLVDQTGGRG